MRSPVVSSSSQTRTLVKTSDPADSGAGFSRAGFHQPAGPAQAAPAPGVLCSLRAVGFNHRPAPLSVLHQHQGAAVLLPPHPLPTLSPRGHSPPPVEAQTGGLTPAAASSREPWYCRRATNRPSPELMWSWFMSGRTWHISECRLLYRHGQWRLWCSMRGSRSRYSSFRGTSRTPPATCGLTEGFGQGFYNSWL